MLRIVLSALVLCLGASQVLAADRQPKEHVVQIVSDYNNLRMYFKPKLIIVQPGDTVTWVNQAAEDHNIFSYPDGFPKGAKPLQSPYLKKKNEKWTHTFQKKGTFEYHCIPHLPMGMHGTVIVGRHSAANEFHEPTASEMKAYQVRLREFYDDEEFKYKPRGKRKASVVPKHKKHAHK
jgi:plastocyanin